MSQSSTRSQAQSGSTDGLQLHNCADLALSRRLCAACHKKHTASFVDFEDETGPQFNIKVIPVRKFAAVRGVEACLLNSTIR